MSYTLQSRGNRPGLRDSGDDAGVCGRKRHAQQSGAAGIGVLQGDGAGGADELAGEIERDDRRCGAGSKAGPFAERGSAVNYGSCLNNWIGGGVGVAIRKTGMSTTCCCRRITPTQHGGGDYYWR